MERELENETVVFLKNIKKTYGAFRSRERVAVEDISLSVKKGEIFGLLGPNGAGKTTTLKIMLGLVFPDKGEASVLGHPPGSKKAHERIGFLPEQPYFHGFLTADKALDLYGRFFGLNSEERANRSKSILNLVGLRADSHLTLDKYSKGMLQRFGIAQALINDPELLILDEPSSGLDPIGQKEMRDLILELRRQGKTIFLSSHQLSEVENVCSSVCIISQGRVVREGKLSALLSVEGVSRLELKGDTKKGDCFKELAINAEVKDGSIVIEVETKKTFPALEEAKKQGLEIVSVTPLKRTLEDLFIEAVRKEE